MNRPVAVDRPKGPFFKAAGKGMADQIEAAGGQDEWLARAGKAVVKRGGVGQQRRESPALLAKAQGQPLRLSLIHI